MKKKQFKHTYFMFLILSVLMVSFNGCSNDDDNTDLTAFLESYAGSIWKLDDSGVVPAEADVPTYARFVNNESKIFESWYEILSEPVCYDYSDGINIEDGVLRLVENSGNKLIIEISYGTTETETFTFTIEGDILKINYVYEETGEPNEANTLFFNKTTDNVDDLTICPQ